MTDSTALQTNREAMKTIVDIFSTGNLTSIPSVISPLYVDHQGLRGIAIRGQEGFGQVVSAARKGQPNLQVVIRDLIAEGDKVAARLEWGSAYLPEEAVVRETIDILRFENGQAVEHWGSPLQNPAARRNDLASSLR